MKKYLPFIVVPFFLFGCGLFSKPQQVQVPVQPNNMEVVSVSTSEPWLVSWTPDMCPDGPEMVSYTLRDGQSISSMVEDITGEFPSAVNVCYAIFNKLHGNTTNALYVKNGWGITNLPIDFISWKDDLFLVGGLGAISEVAVIDEDTVVIDGGYYQTVDDVIDWSSIVGGVYQNEVKFESSRTNFIDGQRYWSATCKGETYSDLEQANACGLGD